MILLANNFYVHFLFESAFHNQENGKNILKYVGSIIIPRVHVKKIFLDPKMEKVLYGYWEQMRKMENQAEEAQDEATQEETIPSNLYYLLTL